MELLPDLATLSDDELRDLIKKLEAEEDQVSYRRRILHGQIDILRSEVVSRRKQAGAPALAEIDLDKLSEILAGKAMPPDHDPQAEEQAAP